MPVPLCLRLRWCCLRRVCWMNSEWGVKELARHCRCAKNTNPASQARVCCLTVIHQTHLWHRCVYFRLDKTMPWKVFQVQEIKYKNFFSLFLFLGLCLSLSHAHTQERPSGYAFITLSLKVNFWQKKNWQFNIKQDNVVTVCLRKKESKWKKRATTLTICRHAHKPDVKNRLKPECRSVYPKCLRLQYRQTYHCKVKSIFSVWCVK